MFKNLIQVNDNLGVISDENGNMGLIEKENDSYSLEEISLKNNECESLDIQLHNAIVALVRNNESAKVANIMDAILVCVVILFNVFTHSTMLIDIFYVLIVFAVISFGCRIGRYIEKKKLTCEIEKLESDLSISKKELAEMMEKSKYRVSDEATIDCKEKTVTKEIDSELAMPINNCASEERNKVRVLSSSKRK